MSTDLLGLEQAAISFRVNGVAAPQGSKSFKGMRTNKATGKTVAVLAESSKKVKPWRKEVHAAGVEYLRQNPGAKILGPVRLSITFHMPRPTGAPRTLDVVPAVQPDLSKLIRSTEDAITTADLWEDDSRVVKISVEEFYAVGPDLPKIYKSWLHEMDPCAWITITPVSRVR